MERNPLGDIECEKCGAIFPCHFNQFHMGSQYHDDCGGRWQWAEREWENPYA